MKSFVEVHFGYCPLVWMFHGRGLNRKINHIHGKSLLIVYKGYINSFNDLLKMHKSVCILHRNIQSLAVEQFQVKKDLSNTIMCEMFPTKVLNYDLRLKTDFHKSTVNTAKFGSRSFMTEAVII